MFTRIRFYVRFTPIGRPVITFDREDHFHPGFGAIIGPNEKGKSMTLEMGRFLLFGSAALRGPTSDYDTLKADGDIVIGDDTIKIERTINTAKLWVNGEQKVRGTTPVTNWIVERLGFGLKVFDVANSFNQGDIEALSNMKPTERQKLIGGVVGLDKIDGLMKYAADEALALDREAKAMENSLRPPVRPAEPEGFPNRGILRDFLSQAEKDQLELERVRGQLAGCWMAEPAYPGERPTELNEVALADHIRDNQRHAQLTAELDRLPVIDVPAAEAALDAYEKVKAAADVIKAAEKSDLLAPEVAAQIIADYDLRDEWGHYEMATSARRELQAKIDCADQVDCPKCAHTFPLNPTAVDLYRAQLADLPEPDAPGQPKPPVPARMRVVAETHLERAAEYEKLQADKAEAWKIQEAGAEIPKYSRFDLEKYDPTRASMIEAELATLTPLAGAEKLLQDLQAWQISSKHYEDLRASYEQQQEAKVKLEARLTELDYAPARLAELRPIIAAIAAHEVGLIDYEHALVAYEWAMKSVEETRAKAEQWRIGREALIELRTLIKQHLFPSLAAAASILIAGMTNGARRQIQIDDEFNVLVDGQRLDTLSGSGKAVANLAIRLGLGQVLTYKSLPMIFADEIDASMDDDRAAATQDILRQCARRVSQLILVSHKTPEADWLIDLGELSEH